MLNLAIPFPKIDLAIAAESVLKARQPFNQPPVTDCARAVAAITVLARISARVGEVCGETGHRSY